MDIVGKGKLNEFSGKHADARKQIESWVALVEAAEWTSPMDIKEHFSHADFLGDGRCVFNIKGNTYRLYVKIAYKTKKVLVKEVGTHAEYDRWDLS
ncbi:MAG: type II toxin-antitoxin system HigB family toxin [Anaerolineales bacterium]